MADKLTPQQAQAVYDRGGKLLVSAAAGSGKTKVLVDRLLTYLLDPMDPANLDEFLIITYTKAAASELRGKIAAKLAEHIALQPENRHLQKQMQRLFLTKISTVHGFCSDLLREYAYRLDIAADFRVADENECRELRQAVLTDLLDRIYEQTALDPDFRAFVDSQGLGRDDRLVPEIIERVFDSARCHKDPDAWLESCLRAADIENVSDVSETLWGRYLIEDVHNALDCQISVMAQCVQAMERAENLEKQTANFREILQQLRELRQASTWDEIVKLGPMRYNRLVFPRKNVDEDLIARVKAARDGCKKAMDQKLRGFADTSEQVLTDLSQTAQSVRGLVALVRQFEQDYNAVKRSRRVLDFGDLEHKALDLLLGRSRSGPTAAAAEIGRRYREVLVDEYQDSNSVQDAIFDAITVERQNCFLVGDVKQSIYQFRLADPGIFLQKYRDYVDAEQAAPRQGRKVLLSHNFRSGGEVIEAVNDVFRICMGPKVGGLQYGDAEALREGIPHGELPGSAVELHVLQVREDTYPEEAAFVADRIHAMLTSGTLIRSGDSLRPVEPEDIVILLRSPGSAGSHFQRALEARGIRCASGGGTDLLQTEEVGTLRSFLQTILNPRLDIPLVSTLVSPVFGFTADELASVRSGQKKGSIFDALCGSVSPKAIHFLDTLSQLREAARMESVTTLLERCFALTRMDSVYAAMIGGETRTANLQAFFRLAADYEKGGTRSVQQFLEYLDSLSGRGIPMEGSSNAGCVTIMSIHKSKGLEFPVVFLANLSRTFNQESVRAQILCDKTLGLGLSVADTVNRVRYPSVAKRAIAVKMIAESLSEELRVLYVAMTRARDRLVMTYAAKNPQKDLQIPALRLDFDGGELLSGSAVCPGDWVLMAAIQRTEAGQLHALGAKPAHTAIGEHPWKIMFTEAPEPQRDSVVCEQAKAALPNEMLERVRNSLAFRYGHEEATQAPSKQTATDRKGRFKDAEAAENTREPKRPSRVWRRPSFREKSEQGKTYGSAIHSALQYLRYENCGNAASVRQEIQRLVDGGFINAEQGSLVRSDKIAAFFQTDLGQKLCGGIPHLREFKFSIQDDGSSYGAGLEGEQVLLQGVVDCALLEPDGITVIDFKTDHVSEENLDRIAERYRPQIQTYGEALSRIYEMPVKAKYLYLFHLDRFLSV